MHIILYLLTTYKIIILNFNTRIITGICCTNAYKHVTRNWDCSLRISYTILVILHIMTYKNLHLCFKILCNCSKIYYTCYNTVTADDLNIKIKILQNVFTNNDFHRPIWLYVYLNNILIYVICILYIFLSVCTGL